MTAEELRIVLAAWVANAGDQKRLAAKLDVSEQYLCDVLKGRREPGKKLLDGIGAERVVTYRMKDVCGVPAGSCTYPDCACVPNGDVGCNSPNAAARGLSGGPQE